MADPIDRRAFGFMTTAAESTGGHVSEVLREEDEPQGLREYQITEDKRTKIQRAADEFYESGPVGAAAAAVADILPGIPWKDIIDPPAKLADSAAQKTRNILGVLGLIGSIYKTPQAVGRVVTNVREPWGYGGGWGGYKANVGFDDARRIEGALTAVKGTTAPGSKLGRKTQAIYDSVKNTVKSIVSDKPLYGDMPKSVNLRTYGQHKRIGKPFIRMTDSQKAASDAREFLYRKMFGLKPRKGNNIFKQNKDGTMSFNPKSKRAKILIDQIKTNVHREDLRHGVMGGYSAKIKSGKIHYEDIWDFKMNPGEWSNIFTRKVYDPSGISTVKTAKRKAHELAGGALRSLVHLMTDPVHIKGKVPINPKTDYLLFEKLLKK